MDQPRVNPHPRPEPEPTVERTTHIGGSETWTVIGTDGLAYTLHWNHSAKVFAGWKGDPQPPTPSFAPANLALYQGFPGGAPRAEMILAEMPDTVAAAIRWALGEVAPWVLEQGAPVTE